MDRQRNDKGSRKDETKAFKGKALERPETATCRPHDNSFREQIDQARGTSCLYRLFMTVDDLHFLKNNILEV